MRFTKLNEIRMPTWRWLKVNDTALDLNLEAPEALPPVVRYHSQGAVLTRAFALPSHWAEEFGQGTDGLQEYVAEHRNFALEVRIPAGMKLDEPIQIECCLDEHSPVLIDLLHIVAEEGSQGEVLVTYRSGQRTAETPAEGASAQTAEQSAGQSGEGTNYRHCGVTYICGEKNSNLRVTKVQFLGDGDTQLDQVYAHVAEKGKLSVFLGELGGKEALGECRMIAAGEQAVGNIHGIYLGNGRKRQDFNYHLALRGVASEGEIITRGALAGHARKLMKSTLDFVKGAAGAKAREEEVVLTLSDKAVNLSVPLLLCGEDHVEGEHATNTGKPDPQKLYYLMTRGFSRQEAKRLLVEASFTPLIREIPSESLRQDIFGRIREVLHEDA